MDWLLWARNWGRGFEVLLSGDFEDRMCQTVLEGRPGPGSTVGPFWLKKTQSLAWSTVTWELPA